MKKIDVNNSNYLLIILNNYIEIISSHKSTEKKLTNSDNIKEKEQKNSKEIYNLKNEKIKKLIKRNK